MRKQDPEKRARIVKAVLEIAYEEGVSGVSYGKIAKRAEVSSGTPYVYFKDRDVMLKQIYEECRAKTAEGLEEAIAGGATPEEKLYNMVSHLAEMYIRYPKEGKFVRAVLSDPDLLKIDVQDHTMDAVNQMYEEILQTGELICDDPGVIHAIVLSPMVRILNKYQKAGKEVNREELDTVIRLSVRAVLR